MVAAGAPAELTRAAAAERALRFDAPAGLPIDELLAALPAGSGRHRSSSPGHYQVDGDIDPQLRWRR